MLLQEIKEIKSSKNDLKKFGVAVGIVLTALSAIFWWIGKEFYLYFAIPGILLIVMGLTIPTVLKPVQKVWMTIAVILGWVMTRVILSILYYLVFTLVNLAARLFSKQFLELKWDKSQKTYWNYRPEKKFDRVIYEKQF